MLITYFRSSSFSQWDYCQQSYYINYVLGIPDSTNKKAQMGTCVHKVLEILANCKKRMQDSMGGLPVPRYFELEDEHIGKIEWNDDDFFSYYELSNKEVNDLNKTRINKYKYKHDAKIPYGTIHYGKEMVDCIFERVYDYYKWEDWAPIDRKDCYNWTWMALEYKDGIFDPRRANIVAAEPKFDITIDKAWGYYEWGLPSGEKISGNLAIKGTIDLVTSHSEGIMEVVDLKTGQRKNWAEDGDNTKTYAKLCKDFQLMLYAYAIKHLYPSVKQVISTIFFVRDGGPYTVCFDEDNLQNVEGLLRERFQEISTCNFPAMRDVNQRDFRCTKLCEYYKLVAPNGDNMCRFIHDQIDKKGIDYVTNKHTTDGFSVGYYQNPGEK